MRRYLFVVLLALVLLLNGAPSIADTPATTAAQYANVPTCVTDIPVSSTADIFTGSFVPGTVAGTPTETAYRVTIVLSGTPAHLQLVTRNSAGFTSLGTLNAGVTIPVGQVFTFQFGASRMSANSSRTMSYNLRVDATTRIDYCSVQQVAIP